MSDESLRDCQQASAELCLKHAYATLTHHEDVSEVMMTTIIEAESISGDRLG